jgi:DNA invertase Pin-like site-specific DNA recombinase
MDEEEEMELDEEEEMELEEETQRPFTEEEIKRREEIADAVKKGVDIMTVARTYNIWPSEVRHIVEMMEVVNKIRTLAAQGMSGYQIAKTLGIWPSQVYMIAKKYGITLPTVQRR